MRNRLLAGLDPNVAKTPRLLTAEVVARGAQSVTDGGVAKDPLFPSGDGFDVEGLVGEKATAAEVGAGYIPYRHQAFIAEEIELAVYLAQGRIDRLPLPEPARQVLALLARLKLARLLAEPLDLRAHCIFTAPEVPQELADPAGLLAALQEQLEACRQLGLLAEPAVTEFALSLAAAKEKPKKAKAGAAVAPTEAEAGAAGTQEEEPG